MGPAERRLKMIKLLSQRRHETMSNLAVEFGVSMRTIQRDIDEIGDLIPIYCRSGRYEGGVYVVEGYYMDRTYMTNKELVLLKKLQDYAAHGETYSFTSDELVVLRHLIENYSIPNSKIVG